MLYSFDNCTIDTDRRELRRKDSLICVEPQVFDLIEYLIRNRKRVVSKDELITAIWGGRVVSESALSTRTNAARSAIGDTGKEQRLIRTHRRKGIRFVAIVHEANDPEATAATVSAEATEPSGTSPRPAPGTRDSRLEGITGTGRRRRLSDDDLARMVEETLAPGAVISDVAGRRGLTFMSRGQARRRQVATAAENTAGFVSAVINEPGRKDVGRATKRAGRPLGRYSNGIIEVEIDGVTIRVGDGADAKTVAAVIRALKAVT